MEKSPVDGASCLRAASRGPPRLMHADEDGDDGDGDDQGGEQGEGDGEGERDEKLRDDPADHRQRKKDRRGS